MMRNTHLAIVATMAVMLAVAGLKCAVMRQDIKAVNDELERKRDRLAAIGALLAFGDIRLSDDLRTVWIPCKCDECQGKGKLDGIKCRYCENGEMTWTNGNKIKCPVCLGTGKRSGVCSDCGGSGKLYLEKSLRGSK